VAAGRLSNIGTTAETLRLKSPSMVPATTNGVGSIVTTRLPDTTNGTVAVTVAPASVSKVRFWLPVRKLTLAPPPPRMIAPMMREPGNSVSVSAPPPMNWSAAVLPEMVPELLTLAVAAMMPKSPPEMVPELVTLAVVTLMPRRPPEMVPELVTLAVVALMPKTTAEMVPELVTLARPPRLQMPKPPVMVPELVKLIAVPPPSEKMPEVPPVIVPELSTVPRVNLRPKVVPVTLAPGTTVMVLPLSETVP
jgi:hypothetical protein